MKAVVCKTKYALVALLAAVVCLLFGGFFAAPEAQTVTASAATSAGYTVNSYDVEMTVQKDRKIVVKELIDISISTDRAFTFYRSLPLEGDRYSDLYAKCEGNEAFSFSIADNPDVSGFMDINCTGGIYSGANWTYEFGYTLEISGNDVENGMALDVIGFGWYVPLNNVTVSVEFPSALEEYTVHSGAYGSEGNNAGVSSTFHEETNTLVLQAERLDLAYNGYYEERMAEGITLLFTLPEGALSSYTATRVFTGETALILLVCVAVVALAYLCARLCRTKRELITTVNIKAPDGMDPLQMGKLLDGIADGEDVTSMIYYFADKGYLSINLSDEDDPVLLKNGDLPETAPAHQKTLFKGLFKNGNEIAVSSLKYKFYESADSAKEQLSARTIPRYEKKSLLGTAACVLLSVLTAFLLPLVAGFIRIGHGYFYWQGVIVAIPAVVVCLIEIWRRSYRYKWNKGKSLGVLLAELVVCAIAAVAFSYLFAEHILTGIQTACLVLSVCLCGLIAPTTLSWTEKYCDTLGQILGFKDFIVHTEEDKIKFMLEESPELYYHILPYAQVLGVSDEWEKKFEKILIEPPSWCVSTHMTVFDYMILNRCIRRATISMMMRPQKNGRVGRSGGGGRFGGFSGGGRGGGGGGLR